METRASKHGVFFLASLPHLLSVYSPTVHSYQACQPATQKAYASVLVIHSDVSMRSTIATPLFSLPILPGYGFVLHNETLGENSHHLGLEMIYIFPDTNARNQWNDSACDSAEYGYA